MEYMRRQYTDADVARSSLHVLYPRFHHVTYDTRLALLTRIPPFRPGASRGKGRAFSYLSLVHCGPGCAFHERCWTRGRTY